MKITLNILIVFVYMFLCSSNGSKDQDDIHHKLSCLEEQKADTKTFDLVIYGKDFAAGEIKVNLKSNPAFGERWEVAGKGVKSVYYNNKLIIIKGIARNRYLGQDIRENYISARLTNTGEKQIMISAVYALPSSYYNGANKLSALSETIEERPHEIEKYSLASHVRPHPFIIEGGKTWTEHIEAPVKTFKPGVREVKWLDILFTDTKIEAKVPAENMMPFFDHVYKRWIETGMIEGIWNTEAGFAGVEAGMQGFVALDPWEQPPLEQWVARYVIPPLHWSIEHNWHFRDQYKLFWYHMSVGDHPRDGGKALPRIYSPLHKWGKVRSG